VTRTAREGAEASAEAAANQGAAARVAQAAGAVAPATEQEKTADE
jgi:hypothetical protein